MGGGASGDRDNRDRIVGVVSSPHDSGGGVDVGDGGGGGDGGRPTSFLDSWPIMRLALALDIMARFDSAAPDA